jgi:histone acetyltransferase (RNA polymerase elongator complex component)
MQKPMEISDIVQKVELNLSTIDYKNSRVEVAFFGGSFTCLDIEKQKEYLEVIQPFINEGKIKSIRISTRPDAITDEILILLKNMHVETIELGVQSMIDDVLQRSGRGHNVSDVINAAVLIRSHGFKLGLQMMVGLPGDNAEKSLFTAQRIVELHPDCVRIYPALVIKNTELENLYNCGVYKALTLEQAVEWVVPLMKLFVQNNIMVIRVGLHPSEGLTSGEKLIAGPYHPSFRQLVMTQIWHEQFVSIPIEDHKEITISVSFSEYNNAIGYKAFNKSYLKQKFRKVYFLQSLKLKDMEFYVDYC